MTQDDTIEANRRLLFAAARGARLRIFLAETRIHPDDQHLQYGPISTALREMAVAEDDETWRTDLQWNIAHILAAEFKDYDWQQYEPDYPLFYLFLAEFLADEGM